MQEYFTTIFTKDALTLYTYVTILRLTTETKRI